MSLLRTIANCFVVPCDERQSETKMIPSEYTSGRPREYDHEIVSGITGKVIGWETPDGESVMMQHSTRFYKSSADEHFEAMTEYANGRFTTSENDEIAHVGSMGILFHCSACGQNYTGKHTCS